MLNDFLQVMKSTAVFMLAGQIVIHFLPAGSYEKYVKMIVGMMILAMLAVPILSFGKMDIQDLTNSTLEAYERQMEQISRQVVAAQLQEKDYTEDALVLQINNKLKDAQERLPVRVTHGETLEDGGLLLYVEETGAAEDTTAVRTVRPVEISRLESGKETPKEEGEGREAQGSDTQLSEIRSSLARILLMEEEQLVVQWDAER